MYDANNLQGTGDMNCYELFNFGKFKELLVSEVMTFKNSCLNVLVIQ